VRPTAYIAVGVVLALTTGCAGDKDANPELSVEPAIEGPTGSGARATADRRGAAATDWPGSRTEPQSANGDGPRVVVGRSDTAGGSAGIPAPPAAPPQANCERIVDHIYKVLAVQSPRSRTAEARDREGDDRAALNRMCPTQATPAFEDCVLKQRTIDGILSCDPITGSTKSATRKRMEEARKNVVLPKPDELEPLPRPLDLPDPVLPQ